MSLQVKNRFKRVLSGKLVWWKILYIMLGILFVSSHVFADNGKFSSSPHGSPTTGVWRTQNYPQGSCAQCHVTHDAISAHPYGLFADNSNQLCFTASLGGCHADQPAGASSGYPAQESDRMPIGSADPGYFEYNNGGVRVSSIQNLVRWPGQVIWENSSYSPHYSGPNMPIKDAFGFGACDNCHNVHGGPSLHDMLDTTYSGVVGSEVGSLPENYALCFSCHNINGPSGMNEASKMIAYYYDRSVNPGTRSGHGIISGGGYVPSGGRLPCYDCHNPHGSAGYNGQGANAFLLSDERPGWYGLTDIKNDSAQVRRFCFGCHPSSDGIGGGTVEGITLSPLPNTVSAHLSTATTHCYDCHGRDYSSSEGHNVHNPSPGGYCVTCHNVAQDGIRPIVPEFSLNAHHAIAIGQNGTVTNEDCGVCHMEGSAQTGDINSVYHRNGLIDLRNPDDGTALTGFTSLTRDTTSAILESWVVEVQNDFCLKCHDANGAVSPDAQVSGGSAYTPFTDQNASVIDVYDQFAPTNTSYHPVVAPGNNPYTVPSSQNNFTATLLPPFNQSANHDLISCFDCHQTTAHGSANSGILRDETYFRQPTLSSSFANAQKNFCGRCHNLQYYISYSNGVSRFSDHNRSPHVGGMGGGGGGMSKNDMSCRGCHAGIYDYDNDASCDNGAGIGRIHGYTHTNLACAKTPGTNPPAFLFGGYISGWKVKDANTNTCYAKCHPTGKDY